MSYAAVICKIVLKKKNDYVLYNPRNSRNLEKYRKKNIIIFILDRDLKLYLCIMKPNLNFQGTRFIHVYGYPHQKSLAQSGYIYNI